MSLTKANFRMIDGDIFNVKDFGATGDGVTDDTAAINACLVAAGDGKVFIPAGTYMCNAVSPHKPTVEGAANQGTILMPFDTAIAAWTHNSGSPFWTYSAVMRDIQFEGVGKVGVGFTFANTDPADWIAGDEFINNVQFYNCYFRDLEKGFQAPAGNIGSSFFTCGWSLCYYGVYLLNSKFGAIMHEANKYFFGCHWESCDVAFYAHAQGNTGGALNFYSCIMETNKIAVWTYHDAVVSHPLMFHGLWLEGNGAADGVANVNVDSWAGTVKSTITPVQRTMILTGADVTYNFYSGNVMDINLEAINSVVNVHDARFESASPSTVVDTSSIIQTFNTFSDGKAVTAQGSVSHGTHQARLEELSSSGTQAGNRGVLRVMGAVSRTNPASLLNAITFEEQTNTGGGTIAITGTPTADGRIFGDCMEYTADNFASNQFTRVNSPDSGFLMATTKKWYFATVDIKQVLGKIRTNIWNRGTFQGTQNFQVPQDGNWHTIGVPMRSPDASAGTTMYLDFSGSSDPTVTWRVSAYQVHEFDTRVQLNAFMLANAYYDGSAKPV